MQVFSSFQGTSASRQAIAGHGWESLRRLVVGRVACAHERRGDFRAWATQADTRPSGPPARPDVRLPSLSWLPYTQPASQDLFYFRTRILRFSAQERVLHGHYLSKRGCRGDLDPEEVLMQEIHVIRVWGCARLHSLQKYSVLLIFWELR